MISEDDMFCPSVTRPLASTVTFEYTPGVTAVLISEKVKVPDVVMGLPETAISGDPVVEMLVTVPVPPVTTPLFALIIRPLASTTMVESVYVPAVTPVGKRLTPIALVPLAVTISPESVIVSLY